ncbi:Conserved_hypothetical protein [Hexamita inflata]|uniref:Uncharacterized protein n=1 Tax=Hexamita inflata TaxID=28002 RepID=A0AA86UBN0_9EUKA|nr:Conserved hypothetical protein [Hexamita inflata]
MSQIIPSQPISISEAEPRNYFVNPYQAVNNRHQTIVDVFGGSSVTYQEPRSSLSGYRPQFKIPTDEFAITPHTSIFQYEGLFTFKFPSAGKYELISGYWYFTKATFDTDHYEFKPEDKRTCVSESAQNAFCVIQKTTPQYSSPLNIDDYIYMQKTTEQQSLSNQFQNAHNKTWFGGDESCFTVEWLPFTIASGTKTYKSELDFAKAVNGTVSTDATSKAYECNLQSVKLVSTKNNAFEHAYIQVKKSFEIPFMSLNKQFSIDTNLYLNALKNQPLTLIIEFVRQQFAYCFDHANKVLVTGLDSNGINRTGIISHKLYLDTKCDPDYLSDASSNKVLENKFIAFDTFTIANKQPVTGTTAETIDRSIRSINDIILMFNPTPTEEWEEFRQQSTFFTVQQCIDLINGKIDNTVEMLFPHKFQLYRQGGNDPVFTEGISKLEVFQYEQIKMMNYHLQQTKQFAPEFKSLMEWGRKYAMICIGLEQFNCDLPVDVIYDGLNNTGASKLRLTYELAAYDDYSEYPSKYNPGKNDIKGKTQISNYDCMCFLNYDSFVQIYPETSKMVVTQQTITMSQ